MTCPHPTVRCINQYELIRKYRCESCGAVMMCACDEDVGPLVPKQLAFAVESDTGRGVPITAGFQSKVCDACRGLPLKPHPKGPSYGSKIKRYYWREIEFETVKRFRTWWQAHGSPKLTLDEKLDVNKKIRREVLDQFKLVHKTAPKYTFATEQQRDVTAEYGIEVVTLRATYGSNSAKRPAIIVDVCGACRVEEYACRHFRSLGYSALVVGNEPIWVLFGVYMSPLIQDAKDPNNRNVGIGFKFDEQKRGELVWTLLPEDFGRPGYAIRRREAIKQHLSAIIIEPGGLPPLFDRWLGPSEDIRQYLAALGSEQVQIARQLIKILPAVKIVEILQYLIENYWSRRSGWPDLLACRDTEILFAEVKSEGDKLRENQEHWIRDNYERLHFPFKLVRVLKFEDHRSAA